MALAKLHSAEEWTAHFGEQRKAAVVTIGNFDGMHLGHQKILHKTCALAHAADLISVVLTFHPHPARTLRPDAAPPLLMTLDRRLAAIERLGVDAALILRFDEALAKVSAEDFACRFLKEALRASDAVIGSNFRFGRGQQGDASLLGKFVPGVHIVPPVEVDGVAVSSSAIRRAVAEGRVEQAARMLGGPFSLAGEITKGTGQGRKLVVPTVNLAVESGQELLPQRGVYATETVLRGKRWPSVTNLGVRPTFDGHGIAVESHLFDFSENITSGPMEIRFLKRLREEQKFSSPAELRVQVLRDIEQAKDFFRNSKQEISATTRN